MVLGYHHVDDELPGSVRRDGLRDQLAWLRAQSALAVLGLDAAALALQSGAPPQRAVVLTFDDAHADFHAAALPLLVEAGLPATLFVPSGLLGSHGHMAVAQLRECSAAGVEIGGHSRGHVDLRGCDDAELEAEVRGCREELEDLLGRPVRSFAYPAGRYDARVEAAVRAAGYRLAVTTRRGWWRRHGDPLQVPRSFVEDASLAAFAAAARGGYHVLSVVDALRGPERLGWARPAASARERASRSQSP
jgi:peptidoglycan/xylan/chitin deacetylase (PgdA/CDA1 family)